MTLENAKRLYAHYVATEQEERAADVLARHPEVAEVVKESKSKGKK